MKFFPMTDCYGTFVAVSLENIRMVECNDHEDNSKDPHICFTYTDNTFHCVKFETGEIARRMYQRVIDILNRPKGVT